MKNGKYFIYIFFIVIILCSCGINEAEVENTNPNEEAIHDFITESAADEKLSNSKEENLPQQEATINRNSIPINTIQETVPIDFNGERLTQFTASIGNTMYFCQWAREGREACLYEIQIGDTSLKKSDIQIPDGMDIYGITGDNFGNLHLFMSTLLTDSQHFTGIIRTVDSRGNVQKEIDVSEAIAGKITSAKSLSVDFDGNYYVKGWGNVLHISSEGKSLWYQNNETMGIDFSYDLTAGSDGEMYMSYLKNSSNCIARIDSGNGSLVDEVIISQLGEYDMIHTIKQRAEGDFLLYGSESGTWIWNREENKLEKGTEFAESGIPYNECIINRSFLEDGRLLLVENISEGNTLVGVTYTYLPAAK